MRRFFIDQDSISGDTAIISGPEARHISTVLRLKPGSSIELFDGNGLVYTAQITNVDKSAIKTTIVESHHHQEYAPFLSVVQSMVKGKKMDLIIQKATELGVSTFQPIITRHCDIKNVPAGQNDRWQRITLEACKQCNRPTPMLCLPTVSFERFVANVDKSTTKVIFWENDSTGGVLTQQITTTTGRALILIGPEGGFAHDEVDAAIKQGFTPATLGPRILRAETAAIAAISIVQFLLGNLNKPDNSA